MRELDKSIEYEQDNSSCITFSTKEADLHGLFLSLLVGPWSRCSRYGSRSHAGDSNRQDDRSSEKSGGRVRRGTRSPRLGSLRSAPAQPGGISTRSGHGRLSAL